MFIMFVLFHAMLRLSRTIATFIATIERFRTTGEQLANLQNHGKFKLHGKSADVIREIAKGRPRRGRLEAAPIAGSG